MSMVALSIVLTKLAAPEDSQGMDDEDVNSECFRTCELVHLISKRH